MRLYICILHHIILGGHGRALLFCTLFQSFETSPQSYTSIKSLDYPESAAYQESRVRNGEGWSLFGTFSPPVSTPIPAFRDNGYGNA